jgi:hypothetical protein
VRKSVRRIKVAMASACPYQTEYHLAYLFLQRAAFWGSRHSASARPAGPPPHASNLAQPALSRRHIRPCLPQPF